MKTTVKTTGQFLVHDVFGGQTISPGEEKEVHVTEFITQALLDKRLEEVEAKGKKAAAQTEDKKVDDEKPATGGPTSGAASKK